MDKQLERKLWLAKVKASIELCRDRVPDFTSPFQDAELDAMTVDDLKQVSTAVRDLLYTPPLRR